MVELGWQYFIIHKMENLILQIRTLSLRKWILVSVAITFVTALIAWGAQSSGSYIASLTLGQVPNLLILIAVTAFAIENTQKIKTITLIYLIGVLVGIIGIFNAFGGLMGVWFDFASSFTRTDLQEIASYVVVKTTTFNMIEYLAFIVALVLGLSSLIRQFKLVWILFIITFALSFVNIFCLQMEVYMYDEYVMVNMIPSCVFWAALIIILIKGYKAPGVVTTQSLDSAASVEADSHDVSNSFITKSQNLFQLKELLDSGVLTPEEFEAEKQKILNK